MSKLQKGLDALSIQYNNDMLMKFKKYYEIMIEWNSFINLTSIIDYEEVEIKHFIDSLSIVNIFPEIKDKTKYTVLDMGTGAGFPGIPLKIVFDNLDIVLMDSLNKRVNFLNHVINELSLNGIKAVHYRAEEAARNNIYREKYDICVSRAVAKMSTLSEYCIPFVKKGGYFIPYKSGKVDSEINEAKRAVSILGGKIIREEKFILPESDIERILILVEKDKHTPDMFPRAGGKPVKEPL